MFMALVTPPYVECSLLCCAAVHVHVQCMCDCRCIFGFGQKPASGVAADLQDHKAVTLPTRQQTLYSHQHQ